MNSFSQQFTARGKILITAEYLVLKGAVGLCIPLIKKNQTLRVKKAQKSGIHWSSFEKQQIWFEAHINSELQLISSTDAEIAQKLISILKEIKTLRPEIEFNFLDFQTDLNFDRYFGLGSSSTLISLLSEWSGANPYKILENTFGGSGYDLACAVSEKALLYQKNQTPIEISWEPSFKNQLYFVYLNKKQSSQIEVQNFLENQNDFHTEIYRINEITKDIIKANSLEEFTKLINEHEEIISQILQRKTIKDELFADYSGLIKSLGAWGGDFILVSSKDSNLEYFKTKGYTKVYSWNEFIYE